MDQVWIKEFYREIDGGVPDFPVKALAQLQRQATFPSGTAGAGGGGQKHRAGNAVDSREVEIYSDATNRAVMRHPDRRFPGVLLQGDDLYRLCQIADAVCEGIERGHPAFPEANALRNALWSELTHYKSVLIDHGISIPFSEQSTP